MPVPTVEMIVLGMNELIEIIHELKNKASTINTSHDSEK
ncbi:unnamed protein product, partial [Rotaria socialis]